MTGEIKHLVGDRGFGFIEDADGLEYFFHARDLVAGSGSFGSLYRGQRAWFEPVATDRGRAAVRVEVR